jgi:16S rRNA (adenine1518-N6/adenine1519-N6)-dimethyltransferase
LNLADPKHLRAFLSKHELSARKGLGQHFLCSSTVVGAIAAEVQGCGGVLEIGPGPGVLTSALSEVAGELIALEVDDRMIAALADSAPKADVRKLDALEADLPTILRELPEPRAVVSNLPYYITGPLITRIAEAKDFYQRTVLMMQREVGERILAPAGGSDRGSLSVYLQTQFEIRRVCKVPPGAFLPPPKVDSVVLALVPKPREDWHTPEFFKLIRSSFAQPRKTLVNNLISAGHAREDALAAVERSGFDERVRPQQLTEEQWVALSRSLFDG